mmetsp:Transcript_29149/g.40039  ORF Transcript_29149/g.40039 Transcript_29149/m.40039 type:complete len:225 (+) Transcript_29149:447-1121(+)
MSRARKRSSCEASLCSSTCGVSTTGTPCLMRTTSCGFRRLLMAKAVHQDRSSLARTTTRILLRGSPGGRNWSKSASTGCSCWACSSCRLPQVRTNPSPCRVGRNSRSLCATCSGLSSASRRGSASAASCGPCAGSVPRNSLCSTMPARSKLSELNTTLPISRKTQYRSSSDSARKTHTILGREVPITRLMAMPMAMPTMSITAICASPLAVMSPILSDLVEKDL